MQAYRGKGPLEGRPTIKREMVTGMSDREQNTKCECCSSLVPVISITKGGHDLYFRDYRCDNPNCVSQGLTQSARSTRRYLRVIR